MLKVLTLVMAAAGGGRWATGIGGGGGAYWVTGIGKGGWGPV